MSNNRTIPTKEELIKRVPLLRNFVEHFKVNVNVHTGSIETLKDKYKNITGIVIVYSDNSGECYIGNSKDVGQWLYHNSNKGTAYVKRLFNNPRRLIVVMPLYSWNYDVVEYFKCFLVNAYSMTFSNRPNQKLLNIEHNRRHPEYRRFINNIKVKAKYYVSDEDTHVICNMAQNSDKPIYQILLMYIKHKTVYEIKGTKIQEVSSIKNGGIR